MMYRSFFYSCLYLSLFFYACTTQKEQRATTALDAARFFIQATLKGDKKIAACYMLQDSLNNYLLNKWEEKYAKLSEAERVQYAQASIIIEKDSVINDSTEIIIFSNSYKKKPYQLKVCKHTGASQPYYDIDLKYTFYGELRSYFNIK